MVDTPKSIPDLLTTVFQDGQADGAITANDIRDLIVSLQSAHGGMYVADGDSAETTIVTQSVPVKAAGVTTANTNLSDMDLPAGTDNRIRYTGALTRHFYLNFMCTIDVASGSNQHCTICIAVNGVPQVNTTAGVVLSASGDEKFVATQAILELATNDYVELWVSNTTSNNNMTVEHLDMHAINFFATD